MNFSDLLGGLLQSGLSPSSENRLRNALGGGADGGADILGSLAGMLGGGAAGGGLGGALAGMLGGGRSGGGLGGLLGDVLGEAGRAAGGDQNLALGGLGALAGALLGGGGKAMQGALGGGLLAVLGAMAFQALKGSGSPPAQVPLGLRAPRTEAESEELERQAELILRAMINAAKADGQIDAEEINRIAGKLKELGADRQAQEFVMAELRKPLETDALAAAAAGRPELAAQVYAASLLAIEVDTPAEKEYLARLAQKLGLNSQVVGRVDRLVGLMPD
jgi:uncharacterized membrane protein YebE (DUF533 family)